MGELLLAHKMIQMRSIRGKTTAAASEIRILCKFKQVAGAGNYYIQYENITSVIEPLEEHYMVREYGASS